MLPFLRGLRASQKNAKKVLKSSQKVSRSDLFEKTAKNRQKPPLSDLARKKGEIK